MGTLFIIGAAVLAAILLIIFLCCIYKVAPIDKALVITGGKEPVIKVSGGSFVIPIFRKADYFDLCMLTVPASGDEIKTKTAIPIIVDWTAQIRPNTQDVEILKKAIISFKERSKEDIEGDVRLTIMGAVRGVVATLTPEQVQGDKETFKEAIIQSVSDELNDMGFKLISLNIQDITDSNGYYNDIAAIDREDKRKEAEKVRATADQQIRQQAADSERIARQSELASELEIAEREKNNKLKMAAFKTETDRAQADADIAGELQRTVREQEVVEQQGRVEVVRQEQANLAAIKAKDVVVTKAQADKQKAEIDAEAQANQRKIQADADVLVAEKASAAIKIKAEAEAERTRKEGQAAADVTRQKGIAEAEVAKTKGLAEAEAEKAKLMAQAEGERALAEARASNDKVNFEIEKIKIEQEARIVIATKTAEIMANLGQNAEFVNIGGCATGNATNGLAGGTGNVLLDTLAGVPALMKKLDVENQALNGKSFNEELSNLVRSIMEPAKGLLVSNTEINEAPPVVPDDANTMPNVEDTPTE